MKGYRCIVCGAANGPLSNLEDRERERCSGCNSNIRLRSVILALSRALYGCDMAMPEWPALKTVRGLGISDSEIYAERLDELFSYTNTFFHREPRFDVTQSDARELGQFDFVLCSEVLEHVAPPVERAFATLRALLKPNGVLILTVPYGLDEATVEQFAGLQNPTLITLAGKPLVIGQDGAGHYSVREDLVFHGGPGSTLEMRVFSESSLRALLEGAGFPHVVFDAEESGEFGVLYSGPCSLPVRAGSGQAPLSAANITELVEEFGRAQRKLRGVKESKWMTLGRTLGLGPKL